jgi:tetratricopeptide (TPR) repeat protein
VSYGFVSNWRAFLTPHRTAKRAIEESAQLRRAGDLLGALVVYDSLPGKLQKQPDIVHARADIAALLRRRAEKDVRKAHKHARDKGMEAKPHEPPELVCEWTLAAALQLRRAGNLLGALALLDSLPSDLQERPDIVHARADIAARLRRRAEKNASKIRRASGHAGLAREGGAGEPNGSPEVMCERTLARAMQLRRAGDLSGALALFDSLPGDLQEQPDIVRARADLLQRRRKELNRESRLLVKAGDLLGALALYDGQPSLLPNAAKIDEDRGTILDLMRRHAIREASRLRRAGNLHEALAVYARLPIELSELPEILYERAHLLRLLGRLDAAEEMLRRALSTYPTQEASWQRLTAIPADLTSFFIERCRRGWRGMQGRA